MNRWDTDHPSIAFEFLKLSAFTMWSFLIDPNVEQLGAAWDDMLTKFVGEAGGGLIYIAGELFTSRIFESAGNDGCLCIGCRHGSTCCPSSGNRGYTSPQPTCSWAAHETWNLELTADGNEDPVFRFAPDQSKNREILASLPGMYWHYPVTRAKPGAAVLAQHGDQRMKNQFGRHVLMALQRFGPGRTVFIGFDATYRWRYLHEQYFDGFWSRLIDRVGRAKVLGEADILYRWQQTKASIAPATESSYECNCRRPGRSRFAGIAAVRSGSHRKRSRFVRSATERRAFWTS